MVPARQRLVPIAAACIGAACSTAIAQQPAPTPAASGDQPSTATKPHSPSVKEIPDQHGGEPLQPGAPDYTGHPKEASVGGSERKVPDHAGIFKESPVSVVGEYTRQMEKWSSENLRLDPGFRAMWSFQQASAGEGNRTAAAQDYRAYATWHAINWEEEKKGWAGNVYARFEWRAEMFTSITPNQLAGQIGALAPTTYGHDEHDPAIVQLYWEQYLADGDLRLRLGKIDPDDYFNLGRWADDYRYFNHTVFSDFPASNHPSGGRGWNAQWYVSPEWTLTTGMSDVQGRKTLAGFDTIDDGNFIYGADVTFSPTISGLGKGNYRLGYEHRDEVPAKDKPADDAFYFNIDQEIAKDVAPFLRIGWGTGRSTGVSVASSIGIGIDNCFDRPGDAFGFGIGLDTVNDREGEQRETEYISEAFYRFQVTRAMQYTIGGQVIFQPINAPNDDVVGVFEMRLVIDF